MESLVAGRVGMGFNPAVASPRPVTAHSDYVLGFPQAPLAAFLAVVHGDRRTATTTLTERVRAF